MTCPHGMTSQVWCTVCKQAPLKERISDQPDEIAPYTHLIKPNGERLKVARNLSTQILRCEARGTGNCIRHSIYIHPNGYFVQMSGKLGTSQWHPECLKNWLGTGAKLV